MSVGRLMAIFSLTPMNPISLVASKGVEMMIKTLPLYNFLMIKYLSLSCVNILLLEIAN